MKNGHLENARFAETNAGLRAWQRTRPARIVIVDGYSTGRELVRELLERNVECLHLRSTEVLPAPVAACFDPTPYDSDLGYAGDADAAAEMLEEFEPDAVVAGSEWGVTFAEQVAHRLGLPSNRFEALSARRDKFDMIEAAREHGLRVAEQASVTTAAEAHAWAEQHGTWPIVVKPMTSAGSDGVTICHTHADIDLAFEKAFGRENFMGCFNDRLLLQSFLEGQQFIVNSVSWAGCHYVTDIWRQLDSVEGRDVVPGAIALMDPRTPEAKALMTYARGVLDALGIEHGAAHTEIKWTKDGPALIETGARLMGAAMDGASYRHAGMQTQASVYASVLAGSAADRAALFAERHYRRGKNITKLLFNFKQAGMVRSTAGLAELKQLPSFHAHYRPLAEGDRVWRTADWLARGGIVYLVHDDAEQIAADIAAFRSWERDGLLYGLVPDGTEDRS